MSRTANSLAVGKGAMAQATSLSGQRPIKSPAIGGDAMAFIDAMLTPEEIAESDLRLAVIDELIKARQEKGISQKKLEELSGVKQPIIARMEKGTTSPQLDTILKVLAPLGKTLAVVSLKGE